MTTGDFTDRRMSRQSVCGLYYEAVSTSDCRALGDKMNSEWHAGKGLKGSCSGLLRYCLEGLRENHKNIMLECRSGFKPDLSRNELLH